MEKLTAEFLKTLDWKGEFLPFSPKEREESRERYMNFSQKESEIEANVREGRVQAAIKPSVPLTF